MSRQRELLFRSWGGRRKNAGRKPGPGRRMVSHLRRTPHEGRCPVHVTLRAATSVPSLRDAHIFTTIQRALRAASNGRFRVLELSVQADHLHLLVEGDDSTGFTRGIQGLAIRVAFVDKVPGLL